MSKANGAYIASIELINIRKHTNRKIDLRGGPVLIIGDARQGKSTVKEVIDQSLGIAKGSPDMVTTGEQSGSWKVSIVVDGQSFDVSRTVTGGKLSDRVKVVSDSVKMTHTDFLAKVFQNFKPENYFDYEEFFMRRDTPAERAQYLMQCVMGDQWEQHKKALAEKSTARRGVGALMRAVQVGLDREGFTREVYDSFKDKYERPMEREVAEQKREEKLSTRPLLQQITEQYKQVADTNNERAQLQKALPQLQAQYEALDHEVIGLQRLLERKQKERDELRTEIDEIQTDLKLNPADLVKENILAEQLQRATVESEEIEKEANHIYESELATIFEFNADREKFLQRAKDLLEFEEKQAQWKAFTTEMEGINQQFEEAFKKALKIEGLSVVEKEDNKGDSHLEVWYRGRELNARNVSRGEAIELYAKIQQAINPGGLRYLFIPEGQSMGSLLQKSIDELVKNGFQVVAELTVPNRSFEVEVIGTEMEEEKPKSKRSNK